VTPPEEVAAMRMCPSALTARLPISVSAPDVVMILPAVANEGSR
jgi:hypothetical protein